MYELFNKIKESRILYIILHSLLDTSTDKNATDLQVFQIYQYPLRLIIK